MPLGGQGFGQLLGLTQPSFHGFTPFNGGAQAGGDIFGNRMSQPDPNGGMMQQGFGSRLLGRGIGALFGDETGTVDLGGDNFFQSGRGFFNNQLPWQGGAGETGGMNFGSFFGSMFGG